MTSKIARQELSLPASIRAAIYARVSTLNGSQDPTMQTRELEEYCQRRGWQVFDCYVDNGVSGKKDSRPHLNRMMQDAHERKFDVVAVATPHIPASELSTMLVIAIRNEEVEIGYELRSALEHDVQGETLQGTLDHLISATPKADWHLILASFLLKCIAEAWNTSLGALRSQKWVLRYKDDVLWAHLIKP